MQMYCNEMERANSYTMVIYTFAYSHGSGLSPGPSPLSNINKCKHKYNVVCLSNKKYATNSWLVEFLLSLWLWKRSWGWTPRTQYILHNKINQPNGDTWRPWIGPRVSFLFTFNRTRVNLQLDKNQPIKMCQRTTSQYAPCHHDGTALHMAVRTIRTGTVSIPNFYLFGSANRLR